MRILGIGTAVPEYEVDQDYALDYVNDLRGTDGPEARLLGIVYRRSGVRRRASVLLRRGEDGRLVVPLLEEDPGTAARMEAYDRLAPALAADAARASLADAGIDATAITHLVTASCTGFTAPGLDISLFATLGLAPTVERTHVGFMGCHGAQNAIRVAKAIADSRPDARVLVVAVELTSLHFRREPDPGRAVIEAIFGDGAGALVGASGEGPFTVAATGSRILPDSTDAMSWRIGDRGFEMGLSARVPDLIGEHLLPFVAEWLAADGLEPADVRTWAIHPGGPRILDAAAAALSLPPDATEVSRAVLADHGNMSSPTILFVLDRLRRRDAPRPLVALGFGPGLTAEALRIDAR